MMKKVATIRDLKMSILANKEKFFRIDSSDTNKIVKKGISYRQSMSKKSTRKFTFTMSW